MEASPHQLHDLTFPARSAGPVLVIAACLLSLPAAGATEPARKPLDPIAQALVDSIRHRKPTTAADLLDATIMAADADALVDALDFFRQFVDVVAKAGEARRDLLADLGDRVDPGALRRLERSLLPYEPEVEQVLGAIRDSASLRRRDPQRLAAAAAALRHPSMDVRIAAADQLARSRTDALPVLVALLETDDQAGGRARGIARGLIHDMGNAGRAALLAWLGSDDVARWPGVIAGLAACGDEDAEYFLAPALVADAPPAVRQAAINALAAHGIAPSPPMARDLLAQRLDRVLTRDGLPAADSLEDKTVEWFVWNPQARMPEQRPLPTRLARAQTAIHLARDLAALGATEPQHIRLVLLARIEAVTALAGDRADAIDAIPPEQLQEALTGPEGFAAATAAEVVDEAASRGLTIAATAAARAIRRAATATRPESERPADPLPPAGRQALVRALSAPDAALAFEAAFTLALVGGEPPYQGASLVVRTLLHAATSTGVDRAVVAHPDAAVVEELAAGLSRHGYETVRVSTGREAILAARASADTVLVLLAARLGSPSALETVELLQLGSDLPAPPVLVVVDPLDDDARGKFLTRLNLSFADVECAAIVDRLDSFFQPAVDPQTGKETPPRFLDALTIAAGPQVHSPERRAAQVAARLTRAAEAFTTLAALAERGWDVTAAVPTARRALVREELYGPAVALLAAVGDPAAQQALFHEARQRDLPETLRNRSRDGFAASVRRHGILLESGQMLGAYAMYNRSVDAESRDMAGDLLDILEAPRIRPDSDRVDAPQSKPAR